MKPGRLFWKLFLCNALLMTLLLAASVWVILGGLRRVYVADLTQRLRFQAVAVREQVEELFDSGHRAALQKLARRLGGIEGANVYVTMVAADGTVLADSESDPDGMASQAARPEIVQALRTGWGRARRASATVQRDMSYVAVRVGSAEAPRGVVRLAMPTPGIMSQAPAMRGMIWRIGAASVLAIVLLALGLAYIWSRPIRRITEAARSLSRGDLSARMEVGGADEFAEMACSLNQMRDSLARQLGTIDRQRQNLAHLIQTLTEGVIVADADGRIVLMNPVAQRLLDLCPTEQKTKDHRASQAADDLDSGAFVPWPVEAFIRHPELRNLLLAGAVKQAAGDSRPSEAPEDDVDEASDRAVQELRMTVKHPDGDTHLLARGSDIELAWPNDLQRNAEGRLVVLTDITELTRTIRMKSDFVANASHELRTPLAAIRASIETLMQMNLAQDTTSADHFMQVIDRHTTRLEELVADLLDLSRLESTATQFVPEQISLPTFLDELHGRFSEPLGAKKLHWGIECAEDCQRIEVSRRLLRLVLDNLLANAIKFTDPCGHVEVRCRREGGATRIEIADDGCGIPVEDHDRVFERFYQVEQARSDAGGLQAGQRGTGLGLSIVRHAVAAMGGTVELASGAGRGTTVTITIPTQG